MRPVPASVRGWALVVAASLLASLLFAALRLPSPVLFGSLAGGMLHALTSADELDVPAPVFRVGQALVGVVIGALVDLPTLTRMAADWPSVLLVTLGTLGVSLVAGRILALHPEVSPATGA